MSILQVIFRSARETLSFQRLLPFFLLYFSFGILAYLLVLSFVNIVANPPQMIVNAPLVVIDMAAMSVLFVAGMLSNIWLTAALVQSVKGKSTFGRSMNEIKKSYLQIVGLSFVTVLFFVAAQVFGDFRYIVRVFIDLVLLFALPSLVIGKLTFEGSIKKSFQVLRGKVLETIVFWVVNRFALALVFILALFVLTLSTAALLVTSMPPSQIEQIQSSGAMRIEAASTLLSNGFWMVILIAIAAFFMGVITVFDYISRTYYFLELTGRKERKQKSRRRRR
jgi:hypothetical protein